MNSETAARWDDLGVVLVLKCVCIFITSCQDQWTTTFLQHEYSGYLPKVYFRVPERKIQPIAESQTSKHWTISLQGSLLRQFTWANSSLLPVWSYSSVCYDSDSFETEASASKEEPRVSLLAQYPGWRFAFLLECK